MMLLDTNVVSELMKREPDKHVLSWLDQQQRDSLWICSVVAAELLVCVARMPTGLRRQQLALAVSGMLETDFSGRILSFDLDAAAVYADMVAS
jgi:toxin FitB